MMRIGPRILPRSIGPLMLAGLLGGCIGDIGSADEHKIVYELTSTELRMLCAWFDDSIAVEHTATNEEVCELQAAQLSEDPSECYDFRSTCLDDNADAETYEPGRACRSSSRRPPSQCEATVAQVKACFQARQRELEDAAKAASCGDVRGSRLPSATLVACRNIGSGCNALFGTLGRADSDLAIHMAPVTD